MILKNLGDDSNIAQMSSRRRLAGVIPAKAGIQLGPGLRRGDE